VSDCSEREALLAFRFAVITIVIWRFVRANTATGTYECAWLDLWLLLCSLRCFVLKEIHYITGGRK